MINSDASNCFRIVKNTSVLPVSHSTRRLYKNLSVFKGNNLKILSLRRNFQLPNFWSILVHSTPVHHFFPPSSSKVIVFIVLCATTNLLKAVALVPTSTSYYIRSQSTTNLQNFNVILQYTSSFRCCITADNAKFDELSFRFTSCYQISGAIWFPALLWLFSVPKV